MFAFERLALLFFAFFLAAAVLRRQPRAAGVAVTLLAVILAGSSGPSDVRGWLGHAYLAFGYWIPAWMTVGEPSPRVEAWLARRDAHVTPRLASMPRLVVALGDLAYVLCYPLVPVAFVVVWRSGGAGDVDRFWTMVLAAGFVCYGSLPWMVSRPPRLIEPSPGRIGTLARGNAWVLSRISHQRNTFPSGHVAVSVAAALAVSPVSPAAGIVCGVIAVGVAVGAVTGRYHYVADVVAGLVVGGATALL